MFCLDEENPSTNEWTRGEIKAVNLQTQTGSVYLTDFGYIENNINFR